jgi:catechol 2,3-dioxygenase-like lactoylglutathione lyase family enzyme
MRLNHVTLIVTNLERSMVFYHALGLVPIVREPPRYARFVCPDGDESLAPGRETLTPRLSCTSASTPDIAVVQTMTVRVESIRQRDHTFFDRASTTIWL